MLTPQFYLRKSIVVFPALLFSCAVILSVSAWSSKVHLRQQSDQIDNRTQALQVTGLLRDANLIKLSLRNNSVKNIKGYTISVGELRMEEDFVYSGRVIAPGEIYEIEIPVSGKSAEPTRKVSILGVIFEDLMGDGDSAVVTAIKERRSGEKLQLMRVNQILEKGMNSPQSDPRNTLNQLRDQISALTETSDVNSSQAINSGLHNVKEEALNTIQRLEKKRQGGALTNLHEELTIIRERNKEKAAKL